MAETFVSQNVDSSRCCIYQLMTRSDDGIYFPQNQGGVGDCCNCKRDPVNNPKCARYTPVDPSVFLRASTVREIFIDD
jgi:hypothetical protein